MCVCVFVCAVQALMCVQEASTLTEFDKEMCSPGAPCCVNAELTAKYAVYMSLPMLTALGVCVSVCVGGGCGNVGPGDGSPRTRNICAVGAYAYQTTRTHASHTTRTHAHTDTHTNIRVCRKYTHVCLRL
jgi:hypothetical protein